MHQRRNQQIGEIKDNQSDSIPSKFDIQSLDFAKSGIYSLCPFQFFLHFPDINLLEILEQLLEQVMKSLHTRVTVLCEYLHICINNSQEAGDIYKPLKVR
jgi:hypothetical protein